MPVDLDAVERELRRIPDVRAARIVADSFGAPIEVHVLAAPGKQAKQLVRDIQSVAIATQGLEIDHRIVSVVQLEDTDGVLPPTATATAAAAAAATTETKTTKSKAAAAVDATTDAPAPALAASAPTSRNGLTAPIGGTAAMPRIALGNVLITRHELRCSVSVGLRGDEGSVEGHAEGSVATVATRRLAAEATLDALGQFIAGAASVSIDALSVMHVGDHDVAVVVLALVVAPYEEIVTGSAPVRATGVEDAIARAVLDACNRRLAAPS